MTSPTARSLKYLRDLGYEAQVVERYNSFSRKRVDLFAFIDIVAIRDGEILGVQTTSAAHTSDRLKKITAEPKSDLWLRAGGRIEVHGWAKRGPRGKRKAWTVAVVPVRSPVNTESALLAAMTAAAQDRVFGTEAQ